MTRLKEDWIRNIEDSIVECQDYLIEKTGRNFKTILTGYEWPCQPIKVAVIPITQGQGIIGSFAESVAAIVKIMGFETIITDKTDVAGIFEAHDKGADIIYMADDERFIALNLNNGKIADNNEATALGYVSVLEGAVGLLNDKKVLILGYGIVGQEILKNLKSKGARVTVFDYDHLKQKELQDKGEQIITAKEEIKSFEYIIDATNTGEWIGKEILNENAWYVSPGVPLSLDKEAQEKIKGRVINDYLQIGVAVMLAMAL